MVLKVKMSTLCWTLFILASTASAKSLHRGEKKELLLQEIAWLLGDKTLCDERKISLPQRNNSVKNTIYINGTVYTVGGQNWDKTPRQAIVVQDGKIQLVGSTADALQHVSCESTVIDPHGSTVLPGMHDVHVHPEADSRMGNTCMMKNDGKRGILGRGPKSDQRRHLPSSGDGEQILHPRQFLQYSLTDPVKEELRGGGAEIL